MKNLDNNKNNLLRFLAGLAVVAVLSLLTAGTCDIKVKKDDDPPFTPGNTGGCTSGFKVELGNTKFAPAFEIGTFSEDATSKAFKANVTIDLSKLTNANGFVSNHVWIHDTAVNPLAFKDMGTKTPPTAGTDGTNGVVGTWEAGTAGADTKGAKFDGVLCAAGKAGITYVSATDYAARSTAVKLILNTEHIALKPVDIADGKPKGVILLTSQIKAGGVVQATGGGVVSAEADLCKDVKYQHGAILQPGAKDGEIIKDGKLLAGFTGPLDGTPTGGGEVNTPLYNAKFETKMNETGAYYTRTNFGYELEEASETAGFTTQNGTAWAADGTMDKVLVTKGSVGYANDSDKLYDEVKAVFDGAGSAMAALSAVFALDNNMGLPSTWDHQPTGTNDANETAFTQLTSAGKAAELGTAANGGWQKAFTIKPCDDKLKNGFAVAYGFATADAMTTWASDPSLEFADATVANSIDTLERKVIIRQGTKDKVPDKDLGNSTAMIFESIVSPAYNGSGKTGFFTYRHDAATANVEDANNAMVTKGVLFCRSALALDGTAAKDRVLKTLTAAQTKAQLEAYDNTTIGYFDGEVKTTSKGLGLTCYLGLSALWPTAIDKAPKLTKTGGVHNVQDVKTDKKDAGKYDYSDKHLGLFMVNIEDKTPINHTALKPFFSGRFGSGVGGKKTADNAAGKAIVKAIKDDKSGKVSYLHGHVTVKFKK